MIEIAEVCPNDRESRAMQRGWGVLHWICIPYTYAFLFGFLIYGLVVERLVETALPPFLLTGSLLATWLVWLVCASVMRKVSVRAAKRTPTGRLPWKWTIGADGIVFTNGLQTN